MTPLPPTSVVPKADDRVSLAGRLVQLADLAADIGYGDPERCRDAAVAALCALQAAELAGHHTAPPDAEAEAGRLREVAKELAARLENVTQIAASSQNPAAVRQALESRRLLDAAWPVLTEGDTDDDA